MTWLEAPTSFRLRQLAESAATTTFTTLKARSVPDAEQVPIAMPGMAGLANLTANATTTTIDILNDHNSHPDFGHLSYLVIQAVAEVVFLALPGFIVAWSGLFDANSQKIVAELNTVVFTPCLIFSKLASQLDVTKLWDLAVIPVIFIAQTLVSWASANLMAKLFGFGGKKRQKNFIVAMGVFGNSNSLPISLVVSLAHTISGLHWDQVPGDNDNEVSARGILYLMIFQQLGQILRWTWGYSYLLKPAHEYEQDEVAATREEGEFGRLAEEGRFTDEPDNTLNGHKPGKPTDSGFDSGVQTPVSISSASSSTTTSDEREPLLPASPQATGNDAHPQSNGSLEARSRSTGHITTFPNFSTTSSHKSDPDTRTLKERIKANLHHLRERARVTYTRTSNTLYNFGFNIFRKLPRPIQKVLRWLHNLTMRCLGGIWRQMNPPLWAMLAALIVASVPALQHAFFDQRTVINNTITRAISQSGGVAVPLILVVLGANLARSALPKDQLATSPAEKAEEKKLLWASVLSRMIIPTVIMAPVLALIAKFVPVSILDDPIFIIVCFLLTGAPSALQLAQICQINNVFMGAMSNLLVWSYVVMIFPSTLVLVMLALEVVEWAVV